MTDGIKNLDHIKVEGFKSIAKLDLPIENINILIGANGSGKTNFISLFTFLGRLSKGKLRNYVAMEGGAERFFHFGTRHTKRMIIDLRVSNKSYHVEFSPNLDDDSLVFVWEFGRSETSSMLITDIGESGFASNEQVGGVKQYLETCRVYHFHDTSNQALFKKTNKLVNYHYFEKDAANIAPDLYHLKTGDSVSDRQSYQQIISAIRSVAPFFHDFYLEPSGEDGDENIILRWTHTKYETPFSANVLSDGTARFICLAVLFLQPASRRPGTIIIDEPELGLHPAALNILADIIHATAKETQVICSTQSVAFANLFAPEDFIVVDAEDGVSTFKRLEKEPLKEWLEDYGMGDIWAKNLIGGRPQW